MRVPLSGGLLIAGLCVYCLTIGPFTTYLRNKPMEEKLGFVPSIKLIKPLSADQKDLVGASLVMKVMMYYGGIMGQAMEGRVIAEPPNLQGMSRLLHGAVQLDPYNMDAYYFAQGMLTWDARQYKVANDLLDYGMKYRTWDWYLPFFAGFNSAYFLKDYAKAAEYYKRAGELSGQPLHKSLAGRYLQESGQTDLAIAYLSAMERGEKNLTLKKGYQIRLSAFREVRRIELARDQYRRQRRTLPTSVEQLVQAGLLIPPPVDPYGGRFYLEEDGKVKSTSKFAFAGMKGEKKMPAIEISELGKTFKGKKGSAVDALKGISLTVEEGEVFGFLGPNGAGKSTTIKCLMGLIQPSSGNATIMGKAISAADARKTVGYLPENPAFYDYLSAEEYLYFVGRIFQMPETLLARRTEEMLKLLELWDARKRQMRGYSKGMVQRVGLAQTLLHDPDVYILDEPMSGLDPIGRALVKEIILDLKKQGKCVFFSTHITDDVEKVCDRVGVINKGQLLVVDSVVNILQHGVEGYTVLVAAPDGHREELFVEKAALQSFIQQSVSNRQSIEMIEPRRKDMEAFFLEIVA